MAGTFLIRRISTFLRFSSLSRSRNELVAPKKSGPDISYTRALAGTFFKSVCSDISLSSKSSLYTHALTSATSDILFIKRKAASTMPTSIATTRSKNTVRTKVTIRTVISLFGAALIICPNVRQPLML